MQLIGLTGGMATGKSTVAKYFAAKGIPIVDIDQLARPIVDSEMELIKKHCPEAVDNDGVIDRRVLADRLFTNKIFRQTLNSRVHPRIVRKVCLLVLFYYIFLFRQIIIDAPLLFETGFNSWVSVTVVVRCGLDEEVLRLAKRDRISLEEAEKRLSVQMPLAKKCALADFVVDNDGSTNDISGQVDLFQSKFRPSIVLNWIYWSPIPIVILIIIFLFNK
jgi:dephospho-CoA kinase